MSVSYDAKTLYMLTVHVKCHPRNAESQRHGR